MLRSRTRDEYDLATVFERPAGSRTVSVMRTVRISPGLLSVSRRRPETWRDVAGVRLDLLQSVIEV
jgi:hypothetical protein